MGKCQNLCGNPAEGTLDLKILGPTPFCRNCAERYLRVKKKHQGEGQKPGQWREASMFDEWSQWLQQRAQKGQLGTGGDKDLYDFAQDYGISEHGIEKLRRYLFGAYKPGDGWMRVYEERKKNLNKQRKKNPFPWPKEKDDKPKKAASRKEAWMGWGPTVAERQHKVDGWEWDKRMSAYIATKQPENFTCKCGAKLPVPSYTNCKCGKIWNSYVIGTGGENRQAAVEKFMCREVPVRENVIVAGKKEADCKCWKGYERVPGTKPCAEGSCRKCDSHREAMRRHASGKARYVLLPHWDTDEAFRILMQHAQDMGSRTALQVTPELMEQAHKGGFTLHDHVGDAPTEGYMVSLDKNTEHSMPIADLRPEHIQAFVDKHADRLGSPGNYLGGWLDGGKFYLDISSHIPDLNRATGAAVRNKQLGIYDLGKGRTIDTEEAGYLTGHPGVVGRRNRGTAHSAQGRSASGGQRAARGSRVTAAGKDRCPACGRGIRSYDLSGTEDHKGQKWCKGCLPDGIKQQMKKSNLLDAVSTKVAGDEDEDDYASAAWPSDHHPDTGNKLKSTPDDWHRRDKNQRWTGKA